MDFETIIFEKKDKIVGTATKEEFIEIFKDKLN